MEGLQLPGGGWEGSFQSTWAFSTVASTRLPPRTTDSCASVPGAAYTWRAGARVGKVTLSSKYQGSKLRPLIAASGHKGADQVTGSLLPPLTAVILSHSSTDFISL